MQQQWRVRQLHSAPSPLGRAGGGSFDACPPEQRFRNRVPSRFGQPRQRRHARGALRRHRCRTRCRHHPRPRRPHGTQGVSGRRYCKQAVAGVPSSAASRPQMSPSPTWRHTRATAGPATTALVAAERRDTGLPPPVSRRAPHWCPHGGARWPHRGVAAADACRSHARAVVGVVSVPPAPVVVASLAGGQGWRSAPRCPTRRHAHWTSEACPCLVLGAASQCHPPQCHRLVPAGPAARVAACGRRAAHERRPRAVKAPRDDGRPCVGERRPDIRVTEGACRRPRRRLRPHPPSLLPRPRDYQLQQRRRPPGRPSGLTRRDTPPDVTRRVRGSRLRQRLRLRCRCPTWRGAGLGRAWRARHLGGVANRRAWRWRPQARRRRHNHHH